MRLVPRLLIPLAMGLLALSAGCASHSGSGSSGYPEESWYAQRQRAAQEARFRRSYEAVFDESAEEGGPRQAKAVQVARSAIGTPYVPGGRNPGGFDCSGFTSYIYKQFGVTLNRSSKDQVNNGVAVSKSNLQQGDLVFFSTNGVYPTHVGIYIGDGNIVHASTAKDGVKISSLNTSYYTTNYFAARRIV